MADAAVSNTAEGNLVWVRIPPSVPPIRTRNLHTCWNPSNEGSSRIAITRRLISSFLLILAIAGEVASCSKISSPSGSRAVPEQSVCAGVSADAGGCTAERHRFTGPTCRDLALEWAQVLDGAVVAILAGPATFDGQARSSRLRQALVITTVDLNRRLQALNLQASCDVPEFMAAAEPRFSTTLRNNVGASLFDGSPVSTYQDWLADVGLIIRSIDQGESPGPSA